MVSAPSDKKEGLLKELEHFAFRGIPNLSSPRQDNEEEEDPVQTKKRKKKKTRKGPSKMRNRQVKKETRWWR